MNCYKNYQESIHIWYHALDFVKQKTKLTMEELNLLPILYSQ